MLSTAVAAAWASALHALHLTVVDVLAAGKLVVVALIILGLKLLRVQSRVVTGSNFHLVIFLRHDAIVAIISSVRTAIWSAVWSALIAAGGSRGVAAAVQILAATLHGHMKTSKPLHLRQQMFLANCPCNFSN